MPAVYRPYNISLRTVEGIALPGAQVWACTRPAAIANPPSPLAPVFSNTTGTAGPNPVTTNGYGMAVMYLDNSLLYTIVTYHPLTGVQAFYDQNVGTVGSVFGYSSGYCVASDGTGLNFTLPGAVAAAYSPSLIIVRNGLVLLAGLGYMVTSPLTIALSQVITASDVLYAYVPQSL